jgi:hypothetical protein
LFDERAMNSARLLLFWNVKEIGKEKISKEKARAGFSPRAFRTQRIEWAAQCMSTTFNSSLSRVDR